MAYYLIVFIIVLALTKYADTCFKIERKKAGIITSILIILILSLFAGLRATTVGIDVSVYVLPQMERAKVFPSFIAYLASTDVEPLFATIVFINSLFADTVEFTLFVSQLLTIGPLYLCIYKRRESCSMVMAMATYVFVFFNLSLCIMRQSIATALIIFAFVCCSDRKIFRYLFIITACLFHTSIISFVAVIVVFKFLKKRCLSKVARIFVTMITIFVVAFLPKIIEILALNLNILKATYYEVYNLKLSSGDNASILEYGMRGFLCGLVYLMARISKKEYYKEESYYGLLGFIISFAGVIVQYLIRLSYPYNFFLMLTIPESRNVVRAGTSRRIYDMIIIAILIIYWAIIYGLWNWYGTMPYSFR